MEELPKPRTRRVLHRLRVQSSMALEGYLIMMNLQMARVRVRKVETVWIITVKLVWKSMKMPQAREYWHKDVGLVLSEVDICLPRLPSPQR